MRKVDIHFHNCGITVTGTVMDKVNPELADDMWEFIAEPAKCYAHHTISTGGDIVFKPLPPYHPVRIGNQSNPIGKEIPMFTEMKPGQINWRGSSWGVVYDKCTEPLTASGPVMIEIDDEHLQQFCDGCYNIWHQTSLYHNVAVVTVSRKEN